MVLQRDDSALGTVIGLVVVGVAVVGRVVFDWRWGASFAEQPVAFALGAMLAVVAVVLTYRRLAG